MHILFTELKAPSVSKPEDPEETITTDKAGKKTKSVSRLEETIYNERVKQWIRDERSLKASIWPLYNIMWGQCLKMMRDKLTMIKDFVAVETKGGITKLLKETRSVGFQIETNTLMYDTLDEANVIHYSYRQEEGESNAKNLRNFKSIVSAVEHLWGLMFADDVLVKLEREKDKKKKGNFAKTNDE